MILFSPPLFLSLCLLQGCSGGGPGFLQYPGATILTEDGVYVTNGDDCTLEGEVSDPNQPGGDLAYFWHSDRDGLLCRGRAGSRERIECRPAELQLGLHHITLKAESDAGLASEDSIRVRALPPWQVGLRGRKADVVIGIGAGAEPAQYTPDVIDALVRHDNLELILAVRSDEVEGERPGLAEVVAKLNRAGVPVWAWLLLSGDEGGEEETGPYAYDVNAERFYAFWQRFRAWALEEGLDFKGVGLDFELPTEIIEAILGIDDGTPDLDLLLSLNRPLRHKTAGKVFWDLYQEARASGYSTYAVGYFSMLDDLLDGDDDLQMFLATPGLLPDTASNLDIVSTMLYRPNAAMLGLDPGPYFIYAYGRTMHQAYGPQGTIVLKAWPGEQDPDLGRLLKDLHLAKNLGFDRIEIYSLEILLENYGAGVIDVICNVLEEAQDTVISKNALVDLIRAGLGLWDSLANPIYHPETEVVPIPQRLTKPAESKYYFSDQAPYNRQ